LTVLGLLGLALLAVSVLVADRLARGVVRPMSELAAVSTRLEGGDLSARVVPTGPPEIREVGTALNRLAERIRELLQSERETVADLSHRLRTPVTALRLDAEALRDPEEAERLLGDVDELQRAVDRIIRTARRPDREGVRATSDAASVVRDRAAFWRVLAEDQSRRFSVQVDPVHAVIALGADELAAALDAVLEMSLRTRRRASRSPYGWRRKAPDGTGSAWRTTGPGCRIRPCSNAAPAPGTPPGWGWTSLGAPRRRRAGS